MSTPTIGHEVTPAAPSEPETPPGWYPDPVGDHDRRYWDGSAWTEEIEDSGVIGQATIAPPSTVTAPPAASPRRAWRQPKIIVPVAVVAVIAALVIAWMVRDGSTKAPVAREAVVAADAAQDVIGKDAHQLPTRRPSQIPSDFPLPDDAQLIAVYAAAESNATVSATFTTANKNPQRFVLDNLRAAGYEASRDFRLGLATNSTDTSCSTLSSTFGFFRGGELIGLVHTSEPGDKSGCKPTITVAVGPDVVRK